MTSSCRLSTAYKSGLPGINLQLRTLTKSLSMWRLQSLHFASSSCWFTRSKRVLGGANDPNHRGRWRKWNRNRRLKSCQVSIRLSGRRICHCRRGTISSLCTCTTASAGSRMTPGSFPRVRITALFRPTCPKFAPRIKITRIWTTKSQRWMWTYEY